MSGYARNRPQQTCTLPQIVRIQNSSYHGSQTVEEIFGIHECQSASRCCYLTQEFMFFTSVHVHSFHRFQNSCFTFVVKNQVQESKYILNVVGCHSIIKLTSKHFKPYLSMYSIQCTCICKGNYKSKFDCVNREKLVIVCNHLCIFSIIYTRIKFQFSSSQEYITLCMMKSQFKHDTVTVPQ